MKRPKKRISSSRFPPFHYSSSLFTLLNSSDCDLESLRLNALTLALLEALRAARPGDFFEFFSEGSSESDANSQDLSYELFERFLTRCSNELPVPLVSPQLLKGFPSDLAERVFRDLCHSPPLPFEAALHQVHFVYEMVYTASDPNKSGRFYTPPEVARFMVEETFSEFDNSETVLDPACGTGVFLLEALRRYYLTARNGKEEATPIHEKFFGIDRDPLATHIAVYLLQISVLHYTSCEYRTAFALPFRIINGNALIPPREDSNSYKKFGSIHWEKAFGLSEVKFDYIIGNPPFGLSRDDQIPPEENALYKKVYSEWLSGKPNKYLLFLALGYELLKPEATLVFILPNSWLGIRSAQALRTRLLRENGIAEITTFKRPLFPKLGVETIICSLHKPNAQPIPPIIIKNLTSIDDRSFVTSSIQSEALLKDRDARIPLTWSPEADLLVHRVLRGTRPLSSVPWRLTPAIALQVYTTGKGNPPQTPDVVRDHPFHSKKKSSYEHYPYFEGRDVQRYTTSWSGSYLHYGEWVAEYQPLSRYQGPRIVIREVLGRWPTLVQAHLLEDTALYNRSILHIYGTGEGEQKRLQALLGILNSQFASCYFLLKGRKTQRRLFPKLVADDLRDFPIPLCILEEEKLLEQLAEKVVLRMELREEASSPMRDKCEREIDTIVWEIYGFNEVEREKILKAMSDLIKIL